MCKDRKQAEESVRAGAILAFNFFSTVALINLNKYVFSRAQFGFPAALSNLHYAVSWACLAALKRVWPAAVPALDRKDLSRDRDFLAMALLIGSVTPLNNMSLQLNPLPFYQTAKLSVTPVVVVVEYVLDRKVPSSARALSLALVCLFVIRMRPAPRGDATDAGAAGLLCVAIWVPLAAGYKVQFGRLRRKLGNAPTLALMHALFPYALVVQTLLSPLVDPPGLLEYEWTPSAAVAVAASGIGAFFVNFSGFLVVGHLGAIAHVLLGQAKSAMTLLVAAVVFGTSYSVSEIVCATGAMSAIVMYSVLR